MACGVCCLGPPQQGKDWRKVAAMVGLQRTSLRLHLYRQLIRPDQWSQLASKEGADLCPSLLARHGQGKGRAAVAGCSSKGAACLVRLRVEALGGHSQNLHRLFPEWK